MSIGSPQAIATTKVGRNDPCSCGSGQKFKRCCQVNDARVELPLGIGEVPQSRDALGKKLKALTLAAKEHWDAESWVDAIPLFAEITRLKPNSAEAHYDLGRRRPPKGRPARSLPRRKMAASPRATRRRRRTDDAPKN